MASKKALSKSLNKLQAYMAVTAFTAMIISRFLGKTNWRTTLKLGLLAGKRVLPTLFSFGVAGGC